MSQKKSVYDAMKYLSFLTHVGLSLAVPILLCVLLGTYLQRRFGWGQWVVLLSVLLGVGGAASNLISFLNMAYREAKASEEEERRR